MKANFTLFITSIIFSILFIQQSNAQWESLGTGIEETSRQVFSISAPDSNTIWAITWDHELLQPAYEFTRTTDGGEHWMPGVINNIDSTLFPSQIYALDSTTAWLCATDFTTGHLFKTTNGGQTWDQQMDAFNTPTEIPVAVHFFDENNGIVFGAPGQDSNDDQIVIYTTSTGGDSWTKVPPSNMPEQLSGEGMTDELGNGLFSAVGNSIWFPTTMNRVFRSQDMGLNWEVFDNGLTGEYTYFESVSIAMQDSLHGIIISNNQAEAVRTADGWETWESITANLPSQGIPSLGQINYIPGTDGAYLIHGLWDGNTTFMYCTLDCGDNWEVIETGASISCSVFLGPSIGFAGGIIEDAETGGVYKWVGGDLSEIKVSSSDIIVDKGEVVKIFPNPVQSQLQVLLPDQTSYPLPVCIEDINGKTINNQWIQSGDSVDVSALVPGIYFLKTEIDQVIYLSKFIKI